MSPARAAVERHPALAHFGLAMLLGLAPIGLVASGALPPSFDQLGALSGSAAGLILAGVLGGAAGVRALLRRGTIWRVGAGWWLFVLLFPALPTVAALFIAEPLGGAPATFGSVGSPVSFLGLLLFLMLAAGIGEEFGWRGFALPRVQARHGAVVASLVVGTLHSVWHLPLFFLPDVSQYDIAQQAGFLPAFLGHTLLIVALAVQMTWIFNHTRGSVLMVAAYHGSINAWIGYLDVYRGRMAGIWVYVVLMLVFSAVLIWREGGENLARGVTRPLET
ncbi:MAG: CPBP family intramembrane glutamic endopeptidase [Gemmatimonadales bacterium]